MKLSHSLIALFIFVSARAVSESIECPIVTTEKLGYFMATSISLYNGNPQEMGLLKPHNAESDEPQSYWLVNSEKYEIWYRCFYSQLENNHLDLRINGNFKRCEAKYNYENKSAYLYCK